MQLLSPESIRLALQLRRLRMEKWPDVRLTQQQLARALSDEEPVSAVTVSSWESVTAPKLPPRRRLEAYARFFATRRSTETSLPRLLPLEELTPEEHASYQELAADLLALRSSAAGEPTVDDNVPGPRIWHFLDTSPVTLICAELPPELKGPLADPSNPNYTDLHRYADVDALMELAGHIRAENPMSNVRYKIPSDVEVDDLTGHLVLLGGVTWNEMTGRLSAMSQVPVRQVNSPSVPDGEIFVAETADGKREFRPEWVGSNQEVLAADVGLLARTPNPLNSSRTMTICNGIYSRGVYGAVRAFTDPHLREANERYIQTVRVLPVLRDPDVGAGDTEPHNDSRPQRRWSGAIPVGASCLLEIPRVRRRSSDP